VPTVDLPDDELAAVTAAAIRRVIEGDRYPHAPRLDPLRAALARLDAAEAAKDLKAARSEAERKASPNETAPPLAKAAKRARR
jgi:hypothetical protein